MSTEHTGSYCPSKDKMMLTEQEANGLLRRMKKSRKYLCTLCKTWHITSTLHQQRKRR